MNPPKFLLMPDHGMIIQPQHILLENAEVNLLEHAHATGYLTGVAALGSKIENSGLTGRLPKSHSRIHDLGLFFNHNNPLLKLCNYVASLVRIPLVIRQYDAVYAFFPGNLCLLLAIWARLLKKPYGLYVRCNWQINGVTPRHWHFVLRGANFIVATGQAFHQKLKHYNEQIVTEVPLTAFRPLAAIPERPAPATHAKLLFVGRICESKGVLDIVRALTNVKDRFPHVHLFIAGGGKPEEKTAIESLIESLNLREHVSLSGHLNIQALDALYNEVDLLVFPSYYREGFPRVINEAMMYGLPVITCPMPGAEGFLVDNVHCLYCEPKNPHQLADKIIELLSDPQKSKEMGVANFQTIHKLYASFECNSHAEQLMRFLQNIRHADPQMQESVGVK